MVKKKTFEQLSEDEFILIKGAKLHNLKNVDIAIPRNKLVVITGLSGSGKSSLAFDTLYAEGQRRYVESLSSYARQFLGRLDKPQVDYIKGIAPAIAIEQKVNSTNPRSTVGTTTEIYDYMKLLFARIGKTISPLSGKEVRKDEVTDVVNFVKKLPSKSKWLILAPIVLKNKNIDIVLKILAQQGFSRIKVGNDILKINDVQQRVFKEKEALYLVVDRIITKDEESFYHRVADSVQTAFYEGHGKCFLEDLDKNQTHEFSNKFELDGIEFNEPTVHLFSFNNPYGACPNCEGYGSVIGIDEDLVIPNKALSIYEDAVVCWKGEKVSKWKKDLIKTSIAFDFPIHKPYYELSEEQRLILWNGNKYFKGIHAFFKKLEEKTYKIQNRVMLSRYRGRTLCPVCNGKRLKKEAGYVKVGGTSIQELMNLPLVHLKVFFEKLELSVHEAKIAKRILKEIQDRICFLLDVGLGYLTLNRASNTLSGGESQRINLATSLGSALVGSMYILDEPSIGLHSKDTERLVRVLKKLRDLGNTVIVVEHDEEIMKKADYIIDMGPEAGSLGGEVVAKGTYKQIIKKNTLTAEYLSGKQKIEIPEKRRKVKNKIRIEGAREHNLKNISIDLPLNSLTVLTGVSGSGKSTLMRKIVYPALAKKMDINVGKLGDFNSLSGDWEIIKQIEYIDQNPIGKSSRSNPVTYIKAYDEIRSLLMKQKSSKINHYKASHFSFNVDGGRCETCKGEGTVTIEMQFMADVHLECDACKGKRFKKEILDVQFEGKNVADILEMTVEDAIAFFEKYNQSKIINKLLPLQEVGLGYVNLGQASNTLSGGEAQRVKLASFLGKGQRQLHTLFIFDEPSTGLHSHDVKKLLKSFNALIDRGHSIFVIEHNMDIIKSADWVIDLGPEGGENGGNILAEGTPEKITENLQSFTGKYLEEKLF
ncbi:MAG: excinuclease ABC subunit UvrA [Flavobacteriales bacterium]